MRDLLKRLSNDPATTSLLASPPQDVGKWDFVVLQDQSDTPSGVKGAERKQQSIDALKSFYAPKLRDNIMNDGQKVVLYSTWGKRDSFEPMNWQTTRGYREYKDALASDNSIPKSSILIAPVGTAFEIVRNDAYRMSQATPKVTHHELYHPDGSHPSILG